MESMGAYQVHLPCRIKDAQGDEPQGLRELSNNFAKTLALAFSYGGDCDTIGTMAGAIAGAFYGYNSIPGEAQSLRRKENLFHIPLCLP